MVFEQVQAQFIEAGSGAYSRRINTQQRLVYEVLQEQRTVKVIRMWPHHG